MKNEETSNESAMNTLILRTPGGATCNLYRHVPSAKTYEAATNSDNPIQPTDISTMDGVTSYQYSNLQAGIYHYSALMEGYTAVCQVLNCTEEKLNEGIEIDIEFLRMKGNGYERGFVMLNTPEFIAANLESDKHMWGEEYLHLFETPWLVRKKEEAGYHQQTTNEEIWSFITRLKERNENMYVFSLGKAPKYGDEIPLVLFTHENVAGMTLSDAAEVVRKSGRPTVQYTAQIHSNEPASTEGALAMMLDLSSDHGRHLLDSLDIYIIPRINADGAHETVRHAPTTGEDMNRDYLFLNNCEIRKIVSAYNLFLPEICIDGHEKGTDVLNTDERRCTDMEVQVGAGSLNHPAAMTERAMTIALTAIHRGRALGLRTAFYMDLASAMGGTAGSSYFGARNSLSFLVETPGGTTLGRFCLERRVMAQYVLTSTVMAYTAEHADEVMHTVHNSRDAMKAIGETYDESNVITLSHDKAPTGTLPMPMIFVPTGEIRNTEEIPYQEHVISRRLRVRATAYIIPKGLPNEERILALLNGHAIPYESLEAGSSVRLRQYLTDGNDITLSDEKATVFACGAYVCPNTVPSTVLSVIMEPDFDIASGRKMTLLSMGLIEADASGALPVYRYCRDLTDGSVTLDV